MSYYPELLKDLSKGAESGEGDCGDQEDHGFHVRKMNVKVSTARRALGMGWVEGRLERHLVVFGSFAFIALIVYILQLRTLPTNSQNRRRPFQ
jgi:hypothetical protein